MLGKMSEISAQVLEDFLTVLIWNCLSCCAHLSLKDAMEDKIKQIALNLSSVNFIFATILQIKHY